MGLFWVLEAYFGAFCVNLGAGAFWENSGSLDPHFGINGANSWVQRPILGLFGSVQGVQRSLFEPFGSIQGVSRPIFFLIFLLDKHNYEDYATCPGGGSAALLPSIALGILLPVLLLVY